MKDLVDGLPPGAFGDGRLERVCGGREVERVARGAESEGQGVDVGGESEGRREEEGPEEEEGNAVVQESSG